MTWLTVSEYLRQNSIWMCCWNVATYKWKVQIEISLRRKLSFLTGPHFQFRGVGQGIKQIGYVEVISFTIAMTWLTVSEYLRQN
jgi:hypothetical protein